MAIKQININCKWNISYIYLINTNWTRYKIFSIKTLWGQTGADVTIKVKKSITIQCWNNAFWLDNNWHVTWNIQSEPFIWVLHSLMTAARVYKFKCFFNGPFPASFFFIFVFSIQLTVNKFLPMTAFKPRTSGIGSDRSINWATITPLN